jgi:DNA polymerase IV
MRIACVHIANLAVQVALIENPHLHEQPVVIGGSSSDDAHVFDASPEAMICGVQAGMTLRKAYSLCPQAKSLTRNEAVCEGVFENVLDMLDGFSPVVESEALGCAYLDVTGVKNEQEMAGNILKSVSILKASLGLSSGKFFSRIAAVTSKTEAPIIISGNNEKAFIAPFPIEVLPCLPDTKERLYILGIRRVGQLTNFSVSDLIAQFGADGRRIYELAWGHDSSLLVPRKKPDLVYSAVELFPPSIDYLEIIKSCECILNKLLPAVRSRGKLCSEAILRLSYESTSQEMRLIFKEAACSETVVMKRIKACVENIAFLSPVTGIELKLLLASETGRKLQLWQGDWSRRDSMRKLTEGLQSRFGYQPLKKIEVVDSGAIFPERRTRLVDMADR